jgi:hypothetical protein
VVVRDFEVLHGIALAKIARGCPGQALRIVDMKPDEGWSSYALGDATGFIVRHRPLPRKLRRKGGGLSWRFAFSSEQLGRLRRLGRRRTVYLVLVCGGPGRRMARLEIAFLHPEEYGRILDVSSFLPQALTVQSLPRKELWISRWRTRLKIPRQRLDDWKSAVSRGAARRARPGPSAP